MEVRKWALKLNSSDSGRFQTGRHDFDFSSLHPASQTSSKSDMV